jgi:hypothetical protein
MNQSEEAASMPSMSDRASVTRTQVARIAESNVEQMTTLLDQRGWHLDALVARVIASGTDARAGRLQAIDAAKAKHRLARARFEEFKSDGGAQWPLFRSSIERAWTDFEDALEKLTSSLVIENNVAGETHEDPSAP